MHYTVSYVGDPTSLTLNPELSTRNPKVWRCTLSGPDLALRVHIQAALEINKNRNNTKIPLTLRTGLALEVPNTRSICPLSLLPLLLFAVLSKRPCVPTKESPGP